MKKILLENIKKQILPILKQADVRKAALFGSYVRGDNTKQSDIDMLVALPRGKTLLDLVHLKNAIEEVLKKKVDIVEYEGINPLIKDSIFKYQYNVL